jgi:hypothetical protein
MTYCFVHLPSCQAQISQIKITIFACFDKYQIIKGKHLQFQESYFYYLCSNRPSTLHNPQDVHHKHVVLLDTQNKLFFRLVNRVMWFEN